MEAMAAGKPCIATDVGSIPDMINNNINGILIQKQNESQLYEALKLFIESADKIYQFAENARESIKRTNSAEIIIDKYSMLFQCR